MRPLPSWVRRCAFMLLAGGLVACRCGGQQASTEPATRFIEKGAHGVMFIPSIHDLAGNTQALLGSVREAPGGQLLIKASADLTTQLGFDPLTPAGESSAGLDPSRSLAISGIARSEVLMVLPYKDLVTLDATVSRLLGAIGHYGVRKTTQVNGFPVVTYATADATTPSFAYATARGFMLLAHGAIPWAWRSRRQCGHRSCRWRRRRSLSMRRRASALMTCMCTTCRQRSRSRSACQTEQCSGCPSAPASCRCECTRRCPPRDRSARRSSWRQVPRTSRLLPSGLPIYVKGAIDWSAVVHAVEPVLARQQSNPLDTLRSVFKEAGIDFDAELVGNLEPGFAFTIGVAQGADLSNALQFNPRQSNPFQNYLLAGVGRVKDPAKATATMAKIGKALAKYGATVTANR